MTDGKRARMGVGHAPAGPRAAFDAASRALVGLDGSPPRAAILFAPYRGVRHHDLAGQVREAVGADVPVVGGTSFGELAGGEVFDGELVVALIGGEGVRAGAALGAGWARDPEEVAADAVRRAIDALDGEPPRLLVALYDPLHGDMGRLLRGIASEVGSAFPVVGAGTGTGETPELRPISIQVVDDRAVGGSIAMLALGGDLRAATVSIMGFETLSGPHRVTTVEGTLLTGLDDVEAMNVYEAALDAGPHSREAGPGHGVPAYALRRLARPDGTPPSILAVYGTDAARRALSLVVELKPGVDRVEVIALELGPLAASAGPELAAAAAALDGADPIGMLCADCYGWKVKLRSASGDELVPLLAALPGLPLAGMYSGGEIGNLGTPGDGAAHYFANYVLSVALLGAP